MSEIIIKKGRMKHFVKCRDKVYFISSCDTFDAGPETMIFSWEGKNIEDTFEQASKINWQDLYCEHYNSKKDMESRHQYLCEHMEEVINE